jgi:hypothetical protein
VGQWLYALGSGGGGLADAERLNDEPLAHPLTRVEHFADQTQLGEWLRKQTDASIAAVWGFIREFVQWVIGPGAPRFKPISCRTSFPPPSVPHPAYFNQNATPTG